MTPKPSGTTSRQIQRQLAKDAEEIKSLKEQVEVLIRTKTEDDEQIKALMAEIKKLKGNKKGSTRKFEQKDDVKKAIDKFVRAVLFRNVKFAQVGNTSLEESELNTATKMVWRGIKDERMLDQGPNKLTEDDFVEIYDTQVLASLSEARQYIQTRTFAVCYGE